MLRKSIRVFVWVLGISLVVAFVLSVLWSKSRWGYFLSRPGVDSRIVNADRVVSLTPVSTRVDEDGTHSFVIDPDYYIEKSGDISRGGYYALELRVVYALQDRDKLPSPILPLHADAWESPDGIFEGYKWKLPSPMPQMPQERLAPLYALAESTGLLYDGSWGGGKRLAGIIIEAESRNADELLFMALAGEQVGNDHFPYCEFLFAIPKGGGEPQLLSRTRFHFDNAGIEGAEWYVIFGILSLPGLGAALVVALVVFIVGRTRRADRNLAPSGRETP